MKHSIFLCLLLAVSIILHAQSDINMKEITVSTNLGEIVCYQKEVKGTIPILFLHGVYYDHNLWNYQISRIEDHTTISIDMPFHGKSKNIGQKKWTMDDCKQMLIDIMDNLNIEKCYAVGHSWGSMTILRAASLNPKRFAAVALCNMPLEAGGFGAKMQFGFQHTMLGFRDFYTQQVAKAIFGEESRIDKPEIVEYLALSMGQLSNAEIRHTDQAVITNVESGIPFLEQLKVPALALKGKDDYVPIASSIETIIVNGKHTGPLEAPQKVLDLIKRMMVESKVVKSD